jgi:hypothetical protein
MSYKECEAPDSQGMFGEVVPISHRDGFLGLGRAEEHALLYSSLKISNQI